MHQPLPFCIKRLKGRVWVAGPGRHQPATWHRGRGQGPKGSGEIRVDLVRPIGQWGSGDVTLVGPRAGERTDNRNRGRAEGEGGGGASLPWCVAYSHRQPAKESVACNKNLSCQSAQLLLRVPSCLPPSTFSSIPLPACLPASFLAWMEAN
jgi:hypothetical protein